MPQNPFLVRVCDEMQEAILLPALFLFPICNRHFHSKSSEFFCGEQMYLDIKS